MNRLTIKALLLDTILMIKHGHHTAPNAVAAKKRYLAMVGAPARTNSRQLLELLRFTYRDNKIEDEFNATVAKFGLA